ncbi:MAG: response regulator [Burkholderiales bacterium]|nr:response regulator [Opitutaceae bacterium]
MIPAPPPGYLLVVEDSDEDFATVLEAASAAGLRNEIRRATSGDECLRLLGDNKRLRRANPILVLLDLNTPGRDGRDALCSIRQDERLRALPLVVLTTSSNPLDVESCYAAGANAYHTKPVSYPAHLQTLREIFSYWLTSVALPAAP